MKQQPRTRRFAYRTTHYNIIFRVPYDRRSMTNDVSSDVSRAVNHRHRRAADSLGPVKCAPTATFQRMVRTLCPVFRWVIFIYLCVTQDTLVLFPYIILLWFDIIFLLLYYRRSL